MQLPPLAIHNRRLPTSLHLICAGTNGNHELQIETNHKELPIPLVSGFHSTTSGMTFSVNEYDDVIEIDINMRDRMDTVELSCVSQQSKITAKFLLTSGTIVIMCIY